MRVALLSYFTLYVRFAVEGRRATIDTNVFIDSIGALVVLVILLGRRNDLNSVQPKTRMISVLMIWCITVFMIDIPGLLLDGCVFNGARELLYVFDSLYWVLHIAYLWLWLIFADIWVFEKPRDTKRRSVVYALPISIEIAVIIANLWTGWLFMLDINNVYVMGTDYTLCLIPHFVYLASVLALVAVGIFKNDGPAQKQRCITLLVYMLLPICGVAMEFISYGVSWLWPMVAISLLMLNSNEQRHAILDRQLNVAMAAEKAARMDAEMANNRAAIMLSQIQPHFLYNALCVIQDLCHENAAEAERATVAFSRFLRGNLDSLKDDNPIPFQREVSHTQYYLTLERMRFDERLKVEFELKADNFCLPALTLQPIVENAVRYGVMKCEEGGVVRIKSYETDDSFVVVVDDNGIGFDPYKPHNDGRTHIGIENVKHRLHDMCGGELNIVSRPGCGTTATITLPKRERIDENIRG